jgi:hypothetical protein
VIPSSATHYTLANFYPRAQQMRLAYEAHFRLPYRHDKSKQIWNYWHVPGHYTYLRTDANKVIPAMLIDEFVAMLGNWARSELGVMEVRPPNLSIYINGCRQALHNDVKNGRWAYVFSLTRWDERKFEGGETLLIREEVFATETRASLDSSDVTYRIPAIFNQLLVFDDRIVHGVEPVQGAMNPLDCRVILHGHLR